MDFSTPKTARTNGITMEYFEQGEGTPVLLLHGFPEHPFSWRNQVAPIVEAGFRVIVPSQRGYAGTDAPEDSQTYSLKNLVADLGGLLDVLGLGKAVWFGHDWGSFPAWYSGVYAPERVLGLGSLCIPYFSWDTPNDIVSEYEDLRGPNCYISTFQEPGVGEAILERDIEHTFRSMLRGRGYTMQEFLASPHEIQEVPAGVFVGDPQLFGEPIVDDGEIAFYVDVYSRSGFRGPLNWYRALRKDWEEGQGSDYLIDKPALMISAEHDWFVPDGSDGPMADFLPRLDRHVIPDAAHWLQQEKPDEVNSILVPWLKRNFA